MGKRSMKAASAHGEKDTRNASEMHTVREFEERAKKILSRMAYDYYRSGADEQRSLKANRRAFRDFELWYRVLVDVANVNLRTSVLGAPIAMPVIIAPTAYHKLAHAEGECATAKAASDAGTIFVLSTLATTSLEDVARAANGVKWFQLYVHKDRGLTRALIERAQQAGYQAIVLTVDAPLLGRRLADVRNGFALPDGMVMANLVDAAAPPDATGSALANYVAARHDPSLTWHDLAWLKSITSLPIVLKGIVREDDAVRAVQHGCDAIVVSNHGARQLDGSPATLRALPGVVDAVRGRCEVLMDGGVRWGTDVLKALALGARAVLIGRPVLWGLAVDGQHGVARVLEIFRNELTTALTLAGCPSVTAIPSDLVRKTSG